MEDQTPPTTEDDFSSDTGIIAVPTRDRRTRLFKWLLIVVVLAIVISADQATKSWAHHVLLVSHYGHLEVIENTLSFRYTRNPGAAWSFLADKPRSFRVPFFIAINIFAAIFLFVLLWRTPAKQRFGLISLSLILGGAMGNFIDRLRFDSVIDFVQFTSTRWPIFNVADIAISGGIFLMILIALLSSFHSRKRELPTDAADVSEND